MIKYRAAFEEGGEGAEADIWAVASSKTLSREGPNSSTNDPATSENQIKNRSRILGRNRRRRCKEKRSCSSERNPEDPNQFPVVVSDNLFDVVVAVVVVVVVVVVDDFDFDDADVVVVDVAVEVVDDKVRLKLSLLSKVLSDSIPSTSIYLKSLMKLSPEQTWIAAIDLEVAAESC